jgi:hypothetical protein
VVPSAYQDPGGGHGRLYASARSLPLANNHALRPLDGDDPVVRATPGACFVWIGSTAPLSLTCDYEEPKSLQAIWNEFVWRLPTTGRVRSPVVGLADTRDNSSSSSSGTRGQLYGQTTRRLDGHRTTDSEGTGTVGKTMPSTPRPEKKPSWLDCAGTARSLRAVTCWWVEVPSAQRYFREHGRTRPDLEMPFSWLRHPPPRSPPI